MSQCDEATAKFLGESLLNLARQIRHYVHTYPVEFAARSDEAGKKWYNRFVATAKGLAEEMEALLLLTRRSDVAKFCNREQIEATIEDTRNVLDGLRQVAVSAN